MEITIKVNGQTVSAAVTVEVYEYLDQANHKDDNVEMMFEMYAEPKNSYGDITRYFTTQDILVYGKTLKRGFLASSYETQFMFRPIWIFTNTSRPKA